MHFLRSMTNIDRLDARFGPGRKSPPDRYPCDRVPRRGCRPPDGRARSAPQQWSSQPLFCYRHAWQEGDLVVWDNCGTMHRVIPYDSRSGRSMHRTSIAGVESVS